MTNKNNECPSLLKDYVQFSKKVTRWGMISASLLLIFCLAAICLFNLSIESIKIVGNLYASYITVLGVTIGAYQCNSSIQKWLKAKYQKKQVINSEKQITQKKEK